MRDKGLAIASLFEKAEEDGEQVMQRAGAEKFEEEQKSDDSLKAFCGSWLKTSNLNNSV